MDRRWQWGILKVLAWALVAGVLAVSARTVWAEKGQDPKPRFRLELSPRMAVSHPTEGVLVKVRVKIDNPGPDFYCPRVTIEWPGGVDSVQEADCEPWDTLDPKPTYFVSYPRQRRFGGCADGAEVRARIEGGGKTVVLRERFSIMGCGE